MFLVTIRERFDANTRPSFADECRRQAQTVAQADQNDREMMDFLDTALLDLGDEWQA